MNLAELKEAYKARKLALDSAKKEEEKYKALLKDAMLEAGESDYTDEAGYRFERIVQERKSMDEEKLLAELHERNLTSCIATKEVVDEDATLKAVEAGELPQEVLADALYVNDGHVQHKRFLPADKLSVGGKAKYLKNRNQKGIMLKESYVNGSFFMEKGMQDAKPRLNRLVESFLQQIGREIEGGSL